jgi:hypothetical protein
VVVLVKPQLVITDMAGAHNSDLGKTSARLLKGGSWKKQRVVVIIPAADLIPAKVCLSLWNLAFPPNNGVVRILAQGMEVGDAYSQAIEGILAHPDLKDWEYVLTCEHDNMGPSDGVIRLIERMEEHPELHVIGGLYYCKGPGGCAQIWGDASDLILNYRPQPPDPNGGLVRCYGTGMGFTLYRLSMFREWKGPKPFFRTKKGLNGEGIGTQDLSFASEAFKLGYKFAVDCSVRVGHYDLKGDYGPPDMVW